MNALLHFQGLEKHIDSISSTASHVLVQVALCLLVFPFHLALCHHSRKLCCDTQRPSATKWMPCSWSPLDSQAINFSFLRKMEAYLSTPFKITFCTLIVFLVKNNSFYSYLQHGFTQDSDQNSLVKKESIFTCICVYVHM